MFVVGLTGSIGMGKSTAAAYFRERGIPVFDADAEVHRLYEGAATPLVEAEFPGTTEGSRVDRQKLAAALTRSPAGFKRLESLIHPLVHEAEREFLHERARAGEKVAVLEIPLLFETGRHKQMDAVIVVSAPAEAQRQRVLKRPGMTAARFDTILARQTPDSEKRLLADFVVDTGGELEATHRQIDAIIESLLRRRGEALKRHWT